MSYIRIYSYLTKNNLIYSKRFGFRSNSSTNHALTSIIENIQSQLDQGQYVCDIFVDLEKVVDNVDHEILCEKLNHYGVHGNVIKLIKSYLANRKQYVSFNGFDSEIKNIDCGVPQGSSPSGTSILMVFICVSMKLNLVILQMTLLCCTAVKN